MKNSKKLLTVAGFLSVAALLAGCGQEPQTQAHVHSLDHHAAVPSTCQAAGTIEYYSCSGCEKMFSDENGENEITSVVDPIDAHDPLFHAAVASTCSEHGSDAYWECQECHTKFDDEACTTEFTGSLELAYGDHDYIFVEEKDSTEQETGMLAHYKCDDCDKLFVKENNEYKEKTVAELTIAKKVYFDVTFDYDGIDSQHIKANEKATQPTDPTKEADAAYTYAFKEWQLNGVKFDFNTPITSNVTLTPVFDRTAKVYELTFKVNGQGDVIREFTVETESIDEPDLPVANAGYTNSWSTYNLETLQDQEVTVVTSPRTDTAYTVNHYFPKLDGTGYYLYEEEEKTGTTEAQTAAAGLEVVGFTAQEISQEAIAGDGSTEVDIYYSRNEMKFAAFSDVAASTTIETVENGMPAHQKITLQTNQWGIGWTSLVPNFTKEELEASDGIEFVLKMPYTGNVMCSNNNHFASGVAGGNFQVVRLSKSALSDYHGKSTPEGSLENVYNHMIYPGSQGLGFFFSDHKSETISVEVLSANLYSGELSPLANKHLSANCDQVQQSAFVDAANISKFTDAPALPEGVEGMLRIQANSNSYGVTDFRINPTGLVSKEEMLESSEIVMKVYAVAGEGRPTTFNAYLNNEHFQKDNATGQWIDVRIPTRLIGVQESCASLSSAYDSMTGGWVRMPQFQFKLDGSPFNGGSVVFYVGGVKAINKINTLVTVKGVNDKTITYIDQSNIGSIEGAPALPTGKKAMVKVDVTSNQYGVSSVRFDPTNFFTETELRNAQTIDVLVYMKKGTADTFTAMLKNTEQFNKNLAVNQWVTVSIPVQLLASASYSDMVGGWIDFIQFVYDKDASTTYYIGGVSLNDGPQINASNASKVKFIVADQGEFTNTWVDVGNKEATDPAFPEGYNGYVKLNVTTDQYGLCNIRFASGIIDPFNFKHGSKISFKLYCTGEGIDATVALSMDNNHNYGTKNANEWIDFEYNLADFGDAAKRAERCDEWINLCRVQFKSSGAALNKGAVTIYVADVRIK